MRLEEVASYLSDDWRGWAIAAEADKEEIAAAMQAPAASHRHHKFSSHASHSLLPDMTPLPSLRQREAEAEAALEAARAQAALDARAAREAAEVVERRLGEAAADRDALEAEVDVCPPSHALRRMSSRRLLMQGLQNILLLGLPTSQ